MRFTLIVAALALASCVMATDFIATHALYREIKSKATTWTPVAPEDNYFRGWTREQVRRMLGLKRNHNNNVHKTPMNVTNDSFNWKDDAKVGDCVHAIRNQLSCGSCWAFAASEALSDAFCIQSSHATNVVLSPQDEVSCDPNNFGCQGGYLDKAWDYLAKTGIVSDSCFPYSSGGGSVEHCLHGACKDSHIPFHKYKCTEGSVSAASGVEAIKAQIKKYGPVETGFSVYSDFMTYSSGIYRHTSGYLEGGHAVKIYGWGSNFWIVANSWGTGWGENGSFRIAFGECGIDDETYQCNPDLTHSIH